MFLGFDLPLSSASGHPMDHEVYQIPSTEEEQEDMVNSTHLRLFQDYYYYTSAHWNLNHKPQKVYRAQLHRQLDLRGRLQVHLLLLP